MSKIVFYKSSFFDTVLLFCLLQVFYSDTTICVLRQIVVQ